MWTARQASKILMLSDATTFNPDEFLRSLTTHPGVYRMYAADESILYVGKARNLRNRVGSYFKAQHASVKTQALVQRIANIEVTVTHSETEALLLEQTLIKQLKPPFNILLRDDKSYPYIFLSDQEFPRLAYYRGARKDKGRYFGPFPSAHAVRETLTLVQKLFRVRQCEDSYFANRTRPCLQYQIGRCTAPCVGLISPEDYAADVRHTVMFLQGRSQAVTEEISNQMEQAAQALAFERAALLRDQITAIRRVQEQQYVDADGGDVDVFGVAVSGSMACVQVVYVRGGRVLGNQHFIENTGGEDSVAELLNAFLPQFYLGGRRGRDVPREILVPEPFDSADVLADAIQAQDNQRVRIAHNVRTLRQAWQRLAATNAQQHLNSYLANRDNLKQRFASLQELLALPEPPKRLECFDISHTQGEGTVASCVVFDQGGPRKSDYRRFNIEGVTAGDDYAAMDQALRRRFLRAQRGEGRLPDILLIDGGKGQLQQAKAVLSELEIAGVMLLGVAKGVTRKAGLETLFKEDDALGFTPGSDNPGLHLIQHIRDEAHRFAISGHRARRARQRKRSALEDIDGVGPSRRRNLLNHFGGLPAVKQASIQELANVKGISRKMAEDIYAALHGG